MVIGQDGIELRWRRRTVVLPWQDVEYWWLGVPATPAGRAKGGGGRRALLVKPAAHVTDPGAGPRRAIWVDRWERWAVCEPALTDETPDETLTALRHFAGRLEASAVRADAGVGAVDSDLHTTVGPTQAYLPKIFNGTAIGSLIVVLLVFVTAWVLAGDFVFDAVVAGFMALVLLGVAAISFAEAGYLWWHWRQQRTVTVMPDGVAVRTVRYDAMLPWHDVAYWTVGTGSKLSTTFFMGLKNAPNPALRRPVRDIVLAVPAGHVQDPTVGPLGSSWSARHRAWVLCKVSHTNATTTEIVGLLRRFSPEKEVAHADRT